MLRRKLLQKNLRRWKDDPAVNISIDRLSGKLKIVLIYDINTGEVIQTVHPFDLDEK